VDGATSINAMVNLVHDTYKITYEEFNKTKVSLGVHQSFPLKSNVIE
jgi:hypothetical protein